MEYREQILALAKNEPVLPSAVAKKLNTTSILAGAMLAEMCSKGQLKTSSIRVGGSPLYLMPGNENQLLNYLGNLNEKDRRTVEKLKEAKIIRETDADPLTRVSLSQVKDFALPLIVQYEDKQERFWKWFELNDKEAEELIREKLEPKTEKQEKIQETKQETLEPEQPKTETKEPKQDLEETKETTEKTKKEAKPKTTKPKEEKTKFWDTIQQFLKENKIELLENNIIKKTEHDIIMKIPSPMGELTYYCKARSKKKVTEADISAAYVQGQLKKLPTILLIDGDLTKKAKEILPQLQGITIKKL